MAAVSDKIDSSPFTTKLLMTLKNQICQVSFLAALCIITLASRPSALAAEDAAARDKERPLIAVLQSNAPPQEKAITCKKLAVYGSKAAVPALAPLLADRELSSWARIALEAIPDPAADEALRDALSKVQG